MCPWTDIPSHNNGPRRGQLAASLVGTVRASCPVGLPAKSHVRGMRDRMRDRWEVEARPDAHERDPRGVDPRPGCGSPWVCSVTTTEPDRPRHWIRDYGLKAGTRIAGNEQQQGNADENQTHYNKPGVSHRRPAVPPPGGGRVVRLPEVTEITGLSRTTIWRRERDGSFPPPIRLGGERTRAVSWREQDIYDWIDSLSPAA